MSIIARNRPSFEASDRLRDAKQEASGANPDSLWQEELKDLLRSAGDLVSHLDLPANLIEEALPGHRQFPVRTTRYFANLMEKGNINDPLLRQVLPLQAEAAPAPGFVADPLAEAQFRTGKGILHKYHGRALLITTGSCAINCRYCFRRHFPYADNRVSQSEWAQALAHLREDQTISEAILSGGDPLLLPDQVFSDLLDQLENIRHLTTLRIHSRIPIVLPSRLNDLLLTRLDASRLRIVIVIHANHPQELPETTGQRLEALSRCVHALLNQSVLLRGVNDSAATLAELSQRLFRFRVMPYYLHLLDKVEGAAHFDTDESRIAAIMTGLRASLPGYLVPKMVREIPGEASKTPVWV